jgi:hypothetical protein
MHLRYERHSYDHIPARYLQNFTKVSLKIRNQIEKVFKQHPNFLKHATASELLNYVEIQIAVDLTNILIGCDPASKMYRKSNQQIIEFWNWIISRFQPYLDYLQVFVDLEMSEGEGIPKSLEAFNNKEADRLDCLTDMVYQKLGFVWSGLSELVKISVKNSLETVVQSDKYTVLGIMKNDPPFFGEKFADLAEQFKYPEMNREIFKVYQKWEDKLEISVKLRLAVHWYFVDDFTDIYSACIFRDVVCRQMTV